MPRYFIISFLLVALVAAFAFSADNKSSGAFYVVCAFRRSVPCSVAS
jgi:hypothetical protein